MFRRAVIPLFVAIALAGCATAGAGKNPLSWFFGRKAAAEAKTEAKAADVETNLVTAAQTEVLKTNVALAAAAKEHPESRPVQVAQRTNANALGLLNQRAPLSLAVSDEATKLTEGLLSLNAALREASERQQKETEAQNRNMAEELGTLREKVKQLGKERAAEGAENLKLANELRVDRIKGWASTGLSVVLGLAAIAYRLNIGRLQTGLGEALAHVTKTHGEEAGDAARKIAGVVLHTGEQKGVFKIYQALTAK